MPTTAAQPAWKTYADELTMLGHGLALWEPAPLYNYHKVTIGDVGYIRQGCFHLLFSAAMPLGDRTMGLDVPQNFVPLDPGPTIQYQPRMPGALHNGNITEKGAGFVASSDISFIQAGTNLRFESSHKSGAMLLTKFKTFREDVERLGYLRDYMVRNYQSWLDYANALGHMVNLQDIILVTGHDMTLDFAMLAFSSNHQQLSIEFEACLPAVASASASVWGTWRTATSVHQNCGPQHREPPSHHPSALLTQRSDHPNNSRAEYNQCVFLRGFRIHKRAGLFPTIIKAAAGPHDLGSGHRFDEEGLSVPNENPEDSEIEIVPLSDAPLFADPLDPMFHYIFENSKADVAIMHDFDIIALMKGTHTSDVEGMETMVSRLAPDIIEIGPNGCASFRKLSSLSHGLGHDGTRSQMYGHSILSSPKGMNPDFHDQSSSLNPANMSGYPSQTPISIPPGLSNYKSEIGLRRNYFDLLHPPNQMDQQGSNPLDTVLHSWTQNRQITPSEALRDFVLTVQEYRMQTYRCGWPECMHVVTFTSRNTVISHIRAVHLQEKPFVCRTCNATFGRKQDADRHVQVRNSTRKTVECRFCSRVFLRGDYRDKHERTCKADEAVSNISPSTPVVRAPESTTRVIVQTNPRLLDPTGRSDGSGAVSWTAGSISNCAPYGPGAVPWTVGSTPNATTGDPGAVFLTIGSTHAPAPYHF